jgi:hypothetical protein
VKAITPDEIRKRENMPALTAAQKNELNPKPAVAAPAVVGPGGQQSTDAGADAPTAVNGNGNGAMPATIRS